MARKLFPRIDEFKRLLQIDTWNEDKKLVLKDVASCMIADAQKVSSQQSAPSHTGTFK